MKAVVYKDAFRVAVEEVPDPAIQDPQDAIIKVTTANICGSDLHMYEGRTNVERGKVLGHENMGVVVEAGQAVKNFRPGARVSVPFNVACGTCTNCLHGWTSSRPPTSAPTWRTCGRATRSSCTARARSACSPRTAPTCAAPRGCSPWT